MFCTRQSSPVRCEHEKLSKSLFLSVLAHHTQLPVPGSGFRDSVPIWMWSLVSVDVFQVVSSHAPTRRGAYAPSRLPADRSSTHRPRTSTCCSTCTRTRAKSTGNGEWNRSGIFKKHFTNQRMARLSPWPRPLAWSITYNCGEARGPKFLDDPMSSTFTNSHTRHEYVWDHPKSTQTVVFRTLVFAGRVEEFAIGINAVSTPILTKQQQERRRLGNGSRYSDSSGENSQENCGLSTTRRWSSMLTSSCPGAICDSTCFSKLMSKKPSNIMPMNSRKCLCHSRGKSACPWVTWIAHGSRILYYCRLHPTTLILVF